MLRKVFGSKREEVTGQWRELHNEELSEYHAGDQIKKNEMGEGDMGHIWETGDVKTEGWVGRCEGRRALGRLRCILEDNIKMYLEEVGWGLV